MNQLPESGVNKIIHNLEMLCDTKNAHTTYKKNGWKASFKKFRVENQNKEHEENLAIREISVSLIKKPKA